ncbi:MAG: hypothetical protein M0Z94_00025, partial [Dehalococcoidales bacterium]|nr:hypothetical protein [Dehalococcoidales bacterium]
MSRVSRRKFLSRAALALGATPILLSTACQPAAQPEPTKAPAPTSAPAVQPTAAAKPTAAAQPTQAPSKIAGTSLSILWGTFFAKEWQDEMAALVADFGKQSGVKATIDFLGWTDLQPK